jgi:hypothetical protein
MIESIGLEQSEHRFVRAKPMVLSKQGVHLFGKGHENGRAKALFRPKKEWEKEETCRDYSNN